MGKQLLFLCFLAAFYTRQTGICSTILSYSPYLPNKPDAAFDEDCSDPGALRLFDPSGTRTPYDGLGTPLQYCDPGILKWAWMCGESWRATAAKVACREFGYVYDPRCCNWQGKYF